MYGFKRCEIILAIMLWCSVFFSYGISAQTMNTAADGIDVMFILDTSYSMNETDKHNISLEMLKLFTDISYSSRTRIGFVAYNDTIEAFSPLTEMNNDKAKEDFKKSLNSIRRIGRTDTGLGLKKGWELLNDANSGRQPFIVLLTDGEIDVNPSSNMRTAADSLNDINYVVEQAAARKIPIYTVAMGRNGVDAALLEEIAGKTGASNHIADIPQDLLEVFNDIFAVGFKSRIVPIAAVTATGETQEINIKMPDKHVTEANIIFLSSSALKETKVFYGSKDIGFYNTQYYSSVKVMHPDSQEVQIQFKSMPHEVVKVNLLVHYDVSGEVEVRGQPASGKPVTLRAYFVDSNTGRSIADKEWYNTFTATAVIKNLDTNKEIRIPAQAIDNGWEAKPVFQDKGRYAVSVHADNNYYNGAITLTKVKVSDAGWFANAGIVILMAAMAMMIYYRERQPNATFTGKINAYYLKLRHPEAEKVQTVTLLLHNFNDRKKINLFDMLLTENADQGLTEGQKIWFAPGAGTTLILSHTSACTIVVGQTVICHNQKYILHYGEKIHISFPANSAEIELHYLGVNPAEMYNSVFKH